MITAWDNDYKETKLIMQAKASMKPEFKPLAEWIDKKYNVKTVNIIYDTIEPRNQPRLQICFEFASEKEKFDGPTLFSFDPKKQREIGQQLKTVLRAQRLAKSKSLFSFFQKSERTTYDVDDVFVYYSAFKPIAQEEANGQIPKERLEKLKEDINDKNLWYILNSFAIATFFLFTDEQVIQYEMTDLKAGWSKKYFEILKEYDEFNYWSESEFSIKFDSKENFDNKYYSNWYYYMH
jgi:hypothetical protein